MDRRPVFRIAIGLRLHISGWPAILLAPLAIPVVLLLKFAELFGLKTSADLTAQDVEKFLRDALEGTGGGGDWDDFTSIPISDPALDRIREEAALVPLPLDAEGEAALRRLLDEARALQWTVRNGSKAVIPSVSSKPIQRDHAIVND